MQTDERKTNAIHTFKDLDAWKQGHASVLRTYRISTSFPKEELFGLTNQIRRAAVSITSNIAEGFGRQSPKDKAHFYAIAKGSALEVQNQLQIAFDLGYITESAFSEADENLECVARLLYGLIRRTSER